MSQPQKIAIAAETLNKTVTTQSGPLTILHSVSLSIMQGESVAILGASGSGKSTLLGLLAGLDLPTSGHIFIQGSDITRLDEDERARLRAGQIGFVFQSFQLLPALNAVENVMLPLELAGGQHHHTKAKAILAQVGLDKRLNHHPRQLSGGEQQRVALARAFVIEPSLLFADEPTGNLDQNTGAHVIDLMFKLNKAHHTTLILVTHDERLAERCDRRFYIDQGVLSTGTSPHV